MAGGGAIGRSARQPLIEEPAALLLGQGSDHLLIPVVVGEANSVAGGRDRQDSIQVERNLVGEPVILRHFLFPKKSAAEINFGPSRNSGGRPLEAGNYS